MTRLSVNINKIALIRNARGGNLPDLIQVAMDCERFGAQGITVHPRPDERHVRYSDIYDLKKVVTTEYNIEGNPTERFMKIVLEVKPDQVTLVPDAHDALTSNAGWDTIKHFHFLKEIIQEFKINGIRTSIFTDPVPAIIENAALIGTNRVELYTEAYAKDYQKNKSEAIKKYYKAALIANEANIGLNAGHDLNLENLQYFKHTIPKLLEVSIGHALISDALYFGLENTIQLYLRLLKEY
jgi:pyridoxine 5-phosphate synthase